MKAFLQEIGENALVIIIVATLLLGGGATSLLTQANNADTRSVTRMQAANNW